MPLPRSQTSLSLSGNRSNDVPSRRASMYAQPQSAPISRSNSELSLHPPMRRRSLIQTPGVATRPNPGPTAPRSTRSSLRHSHPPTPSMSRQPSTHFEESDNDFLSFTPLIIPKGASRESCGLATPKDSDYSITGAFKFGTLRITNGSPVLTPDPARYLAKEIEEAESRGQSKDYFVRETEKESSGVSSGDVDHPLVTVQCESALGTLDANAVETQKFKLKLNAVGEETKPSLSILVPDINLGDQLASDRQTSLDRMAQDHPSSPLMIQSKQAAVDDDLFEDEAEVCVPEVLDIRVDSSARSSTRQTIDSVGTSEGVNRSDSGFVSNSKSESSQSPSSLAKADSGYSSNVSLRSLRHGKRSATKEDETGGISTDSDQGSQSIQRSGSQKVLEIQVPRPVAMEDHTVQTPQSAKAPTPPPKDEFLLKQISRNPSGATDARANPTTPGRMRRKPLHQQPAAIDTSQTLETQELKSPKALPLSPASANSDGSSSSLSIANNPQKPGRLQRLLSLRSSSSSKQTYTVHETHSVDSRIPSIPKDVEAKLREHTGMYPMTNKRLALKSQISKETLRTILSVGSLEYANDDELPLTPAFFDREDGGESIAVESGGEVNEHSLKQTLASMQSNFKTTAASMLSSKKSLTRKPVPIREPKQVKDDQLGARSSLAADMASTSHLSVDNRFNDSILSSAARPRRSMSMTTKHDHHSQIRTYSLNSPPARVPIDTSSPRVTPEEGQLLSKNRSSPPVSMLTRTSFRAPPPRSPSRPQGPAVPRKEGLDTVARSVSLSAAHASGWRLDHRGSFSGGQSDVSTQPHAASRESLSRHSSLNSQTHSSVHSHHDSVASVRSDFLRESRGSQMHGQHASGTTLKHQASLEGFGRNQLYGAYAPRSTQQGAAIAPRSQFDNVHGHCNPRNGRPMSGQLPWGAPPYVPRGQHRRNLSAGSQISNHVQASGGQPPYRILHSYNSPAYRNAPIWG